MVRKSTLFNAQNIIHVYIIGKLFTLILSNIFIFRCDNSCKYLYLFFLVCCSYDSIISFFSLDIFL